MGEKYLRVGLGAVGVAIIGYGAVRILEQSRYTHPTHLALWLVAALLVHDAVIAPVVLAIGAVLARFVPGRARAYVEGALIAAGLVSSVAVVLIYREHKYGSRSLALLQQDYRAHLVLLLGVIAAVSVLAYAAALVRDRRTNSRSPADQ